jgi:hypothetical protein
MRRAFAIAFGITLGLGAATVAIAARDSSGTYSLSPSSPFVTGTPIASSTMNARFSDISTEMTDSLSRSGKGGMLAPLRAVNGSATLPAFAFTSETGSGLYRAGSSDLRFSVAGSDSVSITASGLSVYGTLYTDTHRTKSPAPLALYGNRADVAGAVGVILDNTTALTASDATLLLVRNGGVNKFSLDKNGAIGSRSNLPAVGQQVSSSTDVFATASATPVDVTNATVTITTTGRPVLLFVQPDGSAADASVVAADVGVGRATVRLLRNGTTVALMAVGDRPVGTLQFLDVPAAGTYTYRLQANTPGAGTVHVNASRLVAYEL